MAIIPLYIPATQHQDYVKFQNLPFIRDQKSGFMTATAGSGEFLMVVLSFRRTVVAAGPLEVSAPSAPSGLHGSCACDHRNQSHAGYGMRAKWLVKR
jgi:hypothetical protein